MIRPVTRGSRAAAAAMVLCASAPADASSTRNPALAELAARSTAVVRATCVRQESRWERGRIFTRVVLHIHETAKGAVAPQIEVRVPGGAVPLPGRADGMLLAEQVAGAPLFRDDAESVIFLWRPASAKAEGAAYQVVAFERGKLDVAADGTVAVPGARAGSRTRMHAASLLQSVRSLARSAR
jgi:hypothetical protein